MINAIIVELIVKCHVINQLIVNTKAIFLIFYTGMMIFFLGFTEEFCSSNGLNEAVQYRSAVTMTTLWVRAGSKTGLVNLCLPLVLSAAAAVAAYLRRLYCRRETKLFIHSVCVFWSSTVIETLAPSLCVCTLNAIIPSGATASHERTIKDS